MKTPLLIMSFILAMTFVVSADNKRPDKKAKHEVVEKVAQDPVQEWDPKTQGIGDLTEGPRTETAPAKRKRLEIVGRLFTPKQFAFFIKSKVVPKINQRGNFKPQFIVLHHTGIPSIRQRPRGFSTDNMYSLAHFYGKEKGWKSGPHLFVDQNGIWVFNALDRTGTHSPSWNRVAWGIEQLGDFTKEEYDSGPGEKIRDHAIAAIAILSIAGKLDVNTLRFHMEDPRTTHKVCPGQACNKNQVLSRVTTEMEKWKADWPTLTP